MRIAPDAFRQSAWHVHRFLADVPLHDVWEIRLHGGGPDRHLRDFRALLERSGVEQAGPAVRALFGLRRTVGALLGWDERPSGPELPAASYVRRLDEAERERSLEPPGAPWGPFRLIYAFENEALGEILNRTVHAFSFMGMAPAPDGYRVHWAIYVKPVGRLTRPYMAVIDPFRRWVVYPSIIRRVERTWSETAWP